MKQDRLIIEDVIWFEENKDGALRSSAEYTFFYLFLMEKPEASLGGQKNLKIATDFKAYQAIFLELMKLGYIHWDSPYLIDWTDIYGGACFTLDLTKLMADVDLVPLLTSKLPEYKEYIHTMCFPSDDLKCDICGSISLSRHLSFGDGEEKRVYCFACHPLNDDIKNAVRSVYEQDGIMAAVEKRIELFEEATKFHIAEGYTISKLLDNFKAENEEYTTVHNPKVDVINRIIKNSDFKGYEAFDSSNGIILWNRKALKDKSLFKECVELNNEGNLIIALYNHEGVVYADDEAIDMAKRMTKNKEWIEALDR